MMKADDWQAFIMRAVGESANGNPISLQLIAQNLEVCDDAKQVLRDRGYGWTGVDLLETAKMVPPCTEPVYTSLEAVEPPHIAECDIIARDSVSELLLVVNQAIAYGWQPYSAPITVHGFWYWPMVRFATSATSGTGEA